MFDLLLGSVRIPFKTVLHILMGGEEKQSWVFIVHNFRLPKAITAVMAGAGLSVAGLLMQTLFRNPLAGPSVLGISHGASLGVAIFVMLTGIVGGTSAVFSSSYGMVISAVLGSSLVLFLVISLSFRLTDSVSVLIVGIMFGFITGSLVNILQYFSDPQLVHRFIIWTFGSLSETSWSQLKIIIPVILLSILMAFTIQKNLNVILLGENYARSAGVRVTQLRYIIIIITGILAGTLTAFTGPIAFIGVAVPHLARLLFRTSDHKILLPATALCGAALMLVCDIISQLPGTNVNLPINSISAIFGAPVIVWIILGKRNQKIDV